MITGAVLAGIAAVTAVGTPASAAPATGSLAGKVVDTTGAALDGAPVHIYTEGGFWDPVASVTTDATGRFLAPGLAAGSYEIQIGLAGGWSVWAPGDTEVREESTKYQVVSRRTTRVASTVPAPGKITGKVTTPAGEPAAGVYIGIQAIDTGAGVEAFTAADGSYTARVDPSHSYVVYFSNGEVSQYSPGAPDLSSAARYQVAPGQTLQVDEQLLPAPVPVG
ncbi:carboxypeptidase-like regulatory domain-containing protein [Actinoplanes utahensis]|uniref:alpha-amylase n=1 Tax=Actinoplanes utahensis TaxID=1869 RepID=A0A0A6UVB3_ACTUT|nr:carboxypeptidase-like regulatory domain-containing protein [Actinoplanes utahensis]KHD78359.1 hypothetical protein MB27_05890 [Actinoplanes utahensis]